MRIAQLIDSLTVGGAQKLLVTFAHAVRDRNVELTAATLRPSRSGELAAELEELGVRVVAMHGRNLFDPQRVAHLVRFLRRERFDVLFTHLTGSNILGPIAGRISGVPTIATLHAVSRAPSPRGALESWALRRARCVVAVGHVVADVHHRRLDGRRCVVVPNPVRQILPLPPAERIALRRELIGTKEIMLLSTAMLTPAKGLSDLLEAFAELRRTHPEAALVIAGAGPLEDDVRAKIDGLALRNHARLVGLRDDVPRLLAAADVYVSASHREGLPLSLLEAMAAGLPVVATDVGDVATVAVEGTGLLVPPGQPPALARCLRSILDDQEQALAMGAAARQHVRQNYRVDTWVERLLQLGVEVGRRGQPGTTRANSGTQP